MSTTSTPQIAGLIESLARDLRRAPEHERTTRGYERRLDTLFERLFDLDGLAHIGDLQLLDDLSGILRENNL